MTALIIAAIDSFNKILIALLEGQTAAQREILWNRHIQVTQPLFDLLIRIENLGHSSPAPSDTANRPQQGTVPK